MISPSTKQIPIILKDIRQTQGSNNTKKTSVVNFTNIFSRFICERPGASMVEAWSNLNWYFTISRILLDFLKSIITPKYTNALYTYICFHYALFCNVTTCKCEENSGYQLLKFAVRKFSRYRFFAQIGSKLGRFQPMPSLLAERNHDISQKNRSLLMTQHYCAPNIISITVDIFEYNGHIFNINQ